MNFYSFSYLLDLKIFPSVFGGSSSRKDKGVYKYHLKVERENVYLQV